MKPGDHPEFFRLPPPPGQSRESTIVLDRNGRFLHDGEPVAHRGLADGFARWIRRHPDDGRFILENGYDWCYLTVEDTPFFVTGLRISGDEVTLELSDGTEEPLRPSELRVSDDDVLRTPVKDGAFEARFTRTAQLAIAPLLGDDDLALVIGGARFPIAPNPSAPSPSPTTPSAVRPR